VGALGVQLEKALERPADLDPIARHDELEGVPVAPQRVVAVPQ